MEWSRRSTEVGEEWRGDGEEGEDGEGDERVRVRRDEHAVVVVGMGDAVADGGEDHFWKYFSKGEGRNGKYDKQKVKYHLIFIFESPRVDKHVSFFDDTTNNFECIRNNRCSFQSDPHQTFVHAFRLRFIAFENATSILVYVLSQLSSIKTP